MGFVAIGDKKVADTTPDLTPYALAQDVEEAFENVVSVEDIAKEITSESTDDEVASAKAVFDELADKADKNYGAENKGKMLVVGEDGEITPDEPTLSTVAMTKNAWQIYDKSKLKDGQEVIITDDDSAEGVIDDSEPRGDATYSSQKIEDEFDKVNYKKINSLISFTENTSNTNTNIYANGNSLAINYQGEAKTHASGNILFTLPEGYRPLVPTYCSFVINGDAFGTVEIKTNGVASLDKVSSGAGAVGRVYFNATIPYK